MIVPHRFLTMHVGYLARALHPVDPVLAHLRHKTYRRFTTRRGLEICLSILHPTMHERCPFNQQSGRVPAPQFPMTISWRPKSVFQPFGNLNQAWRRLYAVCQYFISEFHWLLLDILHEGYHLPTRWLNLLMKLKRLLGVAHLQTSFIFLHPTIEGSYL